MDNNSFEKEALRTFAAFQKGQQNPNEGKYSGFLAVQSNETEHIKLTGYGSNEELLSMNVYAIRKILNSMEEPQRNLCILKIFDMLGNLLPSGSVTHYFIDEDPDDDEYCGEDLEEFL